MIAQQKPWNVLVVGDVCTDTTYMVSKKDNLESNAIATNMVYISSKEGMAANVSNCLKSLNINTTLIGTDIPYRCAKGRFVDYSDFSTLFRVDHDVSSYSLPIRNVYSQLVKPWDAIVISDYNKGFITEETILDICSVSRNVPIFLDTKKTDLSSFSDCIIKINSLEYCKLLSHSFSSKRMIVTLGNRGALDDGILFPPMSDRTVVDTCGAGDAFLAGLVYGHLNDQNNDMSYGIVNSGLSVEHVGTYSPSEQELLEGIKVYRDRN